jgi:hypothetical protein
MVIKKRGSFNAIFIINRNNGIQVFYAKYLYFFWFIG